MRSWVVAGLGVTLVVLGGKAALITLASPDPPGDVVGPALVVTTDGGWRKLPRTAAASHSPGVSSPPRSAAGKEAGSARQGRVAPGTASEAEEGSGHPATVTVPLATVGPAWADATGTPAAGYPTPYTGQNAYGGEDRRNEEGSGSKGSRSDDG